MLSRTQCDNGPYGPSPGPYATQAREAQAVPAPPHSNVEDGPEFLLLGQQCEQAGKMLCSPGFV